MTVTITQREPDKDTMEQHTYTKYDVLYISTSHDGYGNCYMQFTNSKGQRSSIDTSLFKVEIRQH